MANKAGVADLVIKGGRGILHGGEEMSGLKRASSGSVRVSCSTGGVMGIDLLSLLSVHRTPNGFVDDMPGIVGLNMVGVWVTVSLLCWSRRETDDGYGGVLTLDILMRGFSIVVE